MRRPTLVVAVMITAILLASSAVAYAQQSDKTAPDKKTGPITSASHSWNGYHWARTSNPFTLKVGYNVGSTWDAYLDEAIVDWSNSTVLDLTEVAGGAKGRCRPTSGRIEVCNARYGQTDWLGIASIWITGGTHITQATTKVNDTYFNTPTYNTPAWRRLVMCQEIAHDFGLDHQDENFDNENLGSCMDYTGDPDGPPSNEHPNAHDFVQLGTIYDHLDSTTTIGASTASKGPFGDPNDPRNEPGDGPLAWGKEIFRSPDGRASVYEKDFGNGEKKLTHVTWTEERAAKHRGEKKSS